MLKISFGLIVLLFSSLSFATPQCLQLFVDYELVQYNQMLRSGYSFGSKGIENFRTSVALNNQIFSLLAQEMPFEVKRAALAVIDQNIANVSFVNRIFNELWNPLKPEESSMLIGTYYQALVEKGLSGSALYKFEDFVEGDVLRGRAYIEIESPLLWNLFGYEHLQ